MRFSLNNQTRTYLIPLLIGLGIIVLGGFLLRGYQHLATTEVRAKGGTYTEGIIGTPRFINPVLAQSNADKDLTELTFSSLIDIDQEGTITYRIAESLSVSNDKRTYIISIHPDAHFSDGTPINARDIVFTIEKIQSPLIKSPLYSSWAGVQAQETGAREVTFTLDQPYADFLGNLTIGVLPSHLWQDIPDEEFAFNVLNTFPIGSGSYRVKDVSFGSSGSPESYTLVPAPRALFAPYISSLEILLYEDSSELTRAFRRGRIDGAFGISPTNLESVDESEIHTGSLPRSFGIFFNTENNKDTLNSTTRKGLSLAMNREQIVQEVFLGYADAIDNPMGYPSETSFDIESAREALEDAGWRTNSEGTLMKSIGGRNTPLSFTLAYPNIQEMQAVATMIQSQFAEIGVTVTLESYEQSTLTNEVIRTRSYDALLFGYVLEKPSDAFAFWHSSQKNDPGLNISLYENPRADAALANIRIQEDRSDDIEDFLDYWSNDMPAILLYSPQYLYLGKEQLELPASLSHGSDRFNTISRWYLRTRHIWNFLIKDDVVSDEV